MNGLRFGEIAWGEKNGQTNQIIFIPIPLCHEKLINCWIIWAGKRGIRNGPTWVIMPLIYKKNCCLFLHLKVFVVLLYVKLCQFAASFAAWIVLCCCASGVLTRIYLASVGFVLYTASFDILWYTQAFRLDSCQGLGLDGRWRCLWNHLLE